MNTTAEQTAETVQPPPEVLAAPSATQQVNDSRNIIAQARAMVVDSPETYTAAAVVLQNCRGAYKKLDEEEKGITRPMLSSLDRVRAFFKPTKDAVQTAGELLRGKLNAYDAEQKRKAEAEARRREAEARAAREAAERKAREERERAEAAARAEREEAERQRREQERAEAAQREARAEAERAQRAEAEARARGEREAVERAQRERQEAENRARIERENAEAAQREAQKAEGRAERTEASAENRVAVHEEKATTTVAPVAVAEAPKVKGIARRLVWKAEVTDLRALVKAVAEGRAPLSLIQANDKVIGQQARSLQAEFVVDGVRVWSENDVAARAKG